MSPPQSATPQPGHQPQPQPTAHPQPQLPQQPASNQSIPPAASATQQKTAKKRWFKRKKKADIQFPQDSDGTQKPPSWKKAAIGGGVALALFLFGGGVLTGWFAHNWYVAAYTQASSDPTLVEVPVSEVELGTTMPDIRGMLENDALTVLSDLGFATSTVEVESKPWAGAPGIVIEQFPAPGIDDLTDLKIVVSEQAHVPNVLGTDRKDALTTMRSLGAEVVFTEQFLADEVPGTVIKSEPVAGEPLGDSVNLTVVSAGSSFYLNTLDPISGYCSSGSFRLDGKEFPQSIECDSREEGVQYEWDLQRRVDAVEFTLGISDEADQTGGSVTVTAYVDGEAAGEATAKFGEPTKMFIPTEDALRLSLTISSVKPSEDSYYRHSAILGDARVIGTTDNIDQMER